MSKLFPLPLIYNKDGTIKKVKQGTWNKIENHKIYTDWLLFEKLEYTCEEDCYKLTKKIFVDNLGHGLIKNYYNSSPYILLKSLYTNYNWLPWMFIQTPATIWKDFKYHELYAKWLGEILGYTKPDDWYDISLDDFRNNYGYGLLHGYYDASFRKFLNKIFKYEWLEWRFTQTAKNYFDSLDNRKQFAEYLKKKLNYKTKKDWCKLTTEIIQEYGGSGMLYTYYNNSVYKYLNDILYPDYILPWNLRCTSKGFWDNTENHKDYADWLYTELGYTSMEDWYKVSRRDIANNDGGGLLKLHYKSSPKNFVMSIYSDYNWVKSKFQKHYSKGEIEWLEYLKVSIPDMRHALNHDEGQYRIQDTKYDVDGYSSYENSIYEYHGDKFHGNPNKFRKSTYPYSYIQLNPEEIFLLCKKSYSELYANTLKKKKYCEDAGYNYYSIWESDWHRGIRALIKLQHMFRKCK